MAYSSLVCLFPCDPCDESQVDAYYRGEFDIARALDIDCALLPEDWQGRNRLAGLNSYTAVLYRGWILKNDEYHQLVGLIDRSGSRMLCDSAQYRTQTLLSQWYPALRDITFETRFYELSGPDADLVPGLAKRIQGDWTGSVVIRDELKSCKERWNECCFVPDVAKTHELESVLGNFLEDRDILLTPPIAVRRFERLQVVDVTYDEVQSGVAVGQNNQGAWPVSCEWRVMKVGNRLTEFAPLHPINTAGATNPGQPLQAFESMADRILGHDSMLVAADVALTSRGELRLIELSNAQVCRFYSEMQARQFFQLVRDEI